MSRDLLTPVLVGVTLADGIGLWTSPVERLGVLAAVIWWVTVLTTSTGHGGGHARPRRVALGILSLGLVLDLRLLRSLGIIGAQATRHPHPGAAALAGLSWCPAVGWLAMGAPLPVVDAIRLALFVPLLLQLGATTPPTPAEPVLTRR